MQLWKSQAPGHKGVNQQRVPVYSVVCVCVRTCVCLRVCVQHMCVCLVKRMGQAVRGREMRRNGSVTVDGVLG